MTAITGILNALLNTLWQAAALACLVWLGMRLAQPGLNAATRHIIWWIALAAIFVLSCIPRGVSSAPVPAPLKPSASATIWPVRTAPPYAPRAVEAPVTVTETGSAGWPFLILTIWAAAAAHRMTRAIRSYYRLRGMKRRAIGWERSLPGLTRAAQTMISSEVSSPVAVGFVHPAVLLPEKFREELTGAEMDCILLHESAHLARYDDWENLIAQLVAAVAGLHPVAWWILRNIDREREMACDDWVVAHTGAARTYVDSLMRLVERRLAPTRSALASGIFTRRSRLRARIEMLLRRGREFTTAAARIPLAVAVVVLAALVMAGASAPNWIAFAQRPEFEVASVKHSDPKRIGSTWRGGPGTSDPGYFVAENTTLAALAMHAYGARNGYDLEWKSPWMATESYNVAAKVPAGTTKERFGLMLQRLLDERFGLVVHREMRQFAGYRLVVAEKGAKLKKSIEAARVSSQPDVVVKNKIPQFSDSAGSGTLLTLSGAAIRGRHETMTGLARQLVQQLGAPVTDASGIEGEYDYDLSFAPEPKPLPKNAVVMFPPGGGAPAPEQVSPPPPDIHPTLRTAIQEQLGLRLEAVKSVPVEVIVLDKANREPTGN
jgi:uncharacterized protein (TIGR03435 family)